MKRWDIVAFRHPDTSLGLATKRVIAFPGEGFSIRGGDIWVNGRPAARDLAQAWEMAVPVYRMPSLSLAINSGNKVDLPRVPWREVGSRNRWQIQNGSLVFVPQFDGGISWVRFDSTLVWGATVTCAGENMETGTDWGGITNQLPENQLYLIRSELVFPVHDLLLRFSVQKVRGAGTLHVLTNHPNGAVRLELRIQSQEFYLWHMQGPERVSNAGKEDYGCRELGWKVDGRFSADPAADQDKLLRSSSQVRHNGEASSDARDPRGGQPPGASPELEVSNPESGVSLNRRPRAKGEIPPLAGTADSPLVAVEDEKLSIPQKMRDLRKEKDWGDFNGKGGGIWRLVARGKLPRLLLPVMITIGMVDGTFVAEYGGNSIAKINLNVESSHRFFGDRFPVALGASDIEISIYSLELRKDLYYLPGLLQSAGFLQPSQGNPKSFVPDERAQNLTADTGSGTYTIGATPNDSRSTVSDEAVCSRAKLRFECFNAYDDRRIGREDFLSTPEVFLGGTEYALLGDNSLISEDSRIFGPYRATHESSFVGLVVLRIPYRPLSILNRIYRVPDFWAVQYIW